MKIISVKLPDQYVEALDRLVKSGKYINRSDAIRAGIRLLLESENWGTNTSIQSKNVYKKVINVKIGDDRNVGWDKSAY